MDKDTRKIAIAKDDLIRIIRFVEESQKLFHQPMHYLEQDIVEKFVAMQYPEIRYIYYDLFDEIIPNDIKKELWGI